jgi:hypothetical protein
VPWPYVGAEQQQAVWKLAVESLVDRQKYGTSIPSHVTDCLPSSWLLMINSDELDYEEAPSVDSICAMAILAQLPL